MLVILQGILWSIFGIIIYRERIVKANIPKLLSLVLYWIGIPLQIFFLARQSNFEKIVWLPPLVTVLVLFMGLGLVLLILHLFRKPRSRKPLVIMLPSHSGILVKASSNSLAIETIYQDLQIPTTKKGIGSFILASILGNTGFIDLVLIPPLVDFEYWSWIVLYGVAHNILGNYGLGVLIADYYSQSGKNNWLNQLQNLLFLPSLWAFVYGYTSRDLPLPSLIETAISGGVLLVVPGAFILIGMQLCTLGQWKNLRSGILPATIKMIVIPGLIGLLLACFNLEKESLLVLVLMSSMPTAFASVILAEKYNLDRQIIISSLLLSTLFLPVVILFWMGVFQVL